MQKPKESLLAIPQPGNPVSSGLSVLGSDGRPDAVTDARIATALAGERSRASKSMLTDAAMGLISNFANQRTLCSSKSEYRAWIEYCAVTNAPMFLTGDLASRQREIVPYVAYLIQTGIARTWGTLEQYVCAVRKFHRLHNISDERNDCLPRKLMPIFDLVLTNARKMLNSLEAPAPKQLMPVCDFAETLANWDLTDPAEACAAAAHRLIAVTCRRIGDVLPSQATHFRSDRGLCVDPVVIEADMISFMLLTTKNRPLGPPWLGILIPNEFDRECCALTAVRQYARCLLKFGGHLNANAPFFQRFDSNRHCFTGQALTVADLDQACRKKTGSRVGYLRMEGANLMIAAGLRPDYQERYADWSQQSIRCGYKRMLDPLFFVIQAEINMILAAFRRDYIRSQGKKRKESA